MLNNSQIKLIQTAVRAAGIRKPKADGRYRLLLSRYRQPNRQPVTSCKQLNNWQLEDLLAICEAYGWQCPGKEANHFRKKVNVHPCDVASFAQQEAIKYLAGDLGWNERQLAGMIKRITKGNAFNISQLTSKQAWVLIEALKAILGREAGKKYTNLNDIKDDFTQETTDGKREAV